MIATASGRVIGIVQASISKASTPRLTVGPIGAVQNALGGLRAGATGRTFAKLADSPAVQSGENARTQSTASQPFNAGPDEHPPGDRISGRWRRGLGLGVRHLRGRPRHGAGRSLEALRRRARAGHFRFDRRTDGSRHQRQRRDRNAAARPNLFALRRQHRRRGLRHGR